MTEMTLASARAKHAELGEIIAKLMAQAVTTINVAAVDIELREGERYAGAVLNADGTVKHHLVLMADKPSGRLAWQAAKDWAKKVGGFLPTRQEASLIYANCKAHLEGVYHWTSDEYESDASYAWICLFSFGSQYYDRKGGVCAVVAVRRLNP